MDDFSPENVLAPPPPPPPMKKSTDLFMQRSNSFVSKATRDSWDRMFDEAHGADVLIHTDDNGLIYAHSNVIVSSLIQCLEKSVTLFFVLNLNEVLSVKL